MESPIDNLAAYYKHVRKCKICGIEYGDDSEKDFILECPICKMKRVLDNKSGSKRGKRMELLLLERLTKTLNTTSDNKNIDKEEENELDNIT